MKGRGGPAKTLLLVTVLGALVSMGIAAEAPVLVAQPKTARARVVTVALGYEGTPYLYGGTDRDGMDCSGLVFRAYLTALGKAVPRTAAALFGFCEAIPKDALQPGDLVFFNTTGPLAHVGIYEGGGRFIHSASEGQPTGVIESNLEDPYWKRSFAGAGRLVPPAEYLGLVVEAALGPSLGQDAIIRGVSAAVGVSYPVLGFDPGIELRPEFDGTLGVVRVSAGLSIGFGKTFRFFVGPALTLGDPVLQWAGTSRSYVAGGGLAATIGAVWTPLTFHALGQDWGLYAECMLEGYGARAGEPRDSYADLAAGIHAGLGLRIRMGM